MTERARTVEVRIEAEDPPFPPEAGVFIGLQGEDGIEQIQPADRTATFDFRVEVTDGPDGADVRGPHVHGRRGDRFVHLSWGVGPDDADFGMFARAKVRMADLPPGLLDDPPPGGVVCRLQATDDRGRPAAGSIRPPALSWHRVGDAPAS